MRDIADTRLDTYKQNMLNTACDNLQAFITYLSDEVIEKGFAPDQKQHLQRMMTSLKKYAEAIQQMNNNQPINFMRLGDANILQYDLVINDILKQKILSADSAQNLFRDLLKGESKTKLINLLCSSPLKIFFLMITASLLLAAPYMIAIPVILTVLYYVLLITSVVCCLAAYLHNKELEAIESSTVNPQIEERATTLLNQIDKIKQKLKSPSPLTNKSMFNKLIIEEPADDSDYDFDYGVLD